MHFQDQPGRSSVTDNGHQHGPPPWHHGSPNGPLGRRGDRPDAFARWRERGDGQPLRRSREDRLLGGVAAGIAAWRGFNPTTVRIVLAVAVLASAGWVVPFYVLGWLLIPVKGEQHSIAVRARHDSRGVALAFALGSLLVVFLVLAGALNDGTIEKYGWAQVVSLPVLALIWRNAPEDEQAHMRRLLAPLGINGPSARRATLLRFAGAAVLLAIGLGWLLSLHGGTQLLAPLGG